MSPPGTTLPPAHLRIFNSPSNVHDAGKHFACSMASNEHCYFNDDDWLNIYMDSLYTKYLECCSGSGGHGGRIVSNTMPIIHLEHRRWRFENPGGSASPFIIEWDLIRFSPVQISTFTRASPGSALDPSPLAPSRLASSSSSRLLPSV